MKIKISAHCPSCHKHHGVFCVHWLNLKIVCDKISHKIWRCSSLVAILSDLTMQFLSGCFGFLQFTGLFLRSWKNEYNGDIQCAIKSPLVPSMLQIELTWQQQLPSFSVIVCLFQTISKFDFQILQIFMPSECVHYTKMNNGKTCAHLHICADAKLTSTTVRSGLLKLNSSARSSPSLLDQTSIKLQGKET